MIAAAPEDTPPRHGLADADSAWMRAIYLLLAVLIGGPTLYFGGIIALVGIVIGGSALPSAAPFDPKALWLLLWGLGGWIGMLSWLRLSFAYVVHQRTGLVACSGFWWIGLLLGIGTACLMLAIFVSALSDWHTGTEKWLRALSMGPALILPALWLMWLRR